jgi:hypothetical protein
MALGNLASGWGLSIVIDGEEAEKGSRVID